MSSKRIISQINHLDSIILSCRLCEFHKTRTKAVPGHETTLSGLIMIGKRPGFHEDQ